MLSQASIHATIPAQDLARGRAFYENVLDGTKFLLFSACGRASREHTQLSRDTEGNLLAIMQVFDAE